MRSWELRFKSGTESCIKVTTIIEISTKKYLIYKQILLIYTYEMYGEQYGEYAS